jgi:hypothetical protein
MKLPDRIPPSIAVVLGVILGALMASLGMYAYMGQKGRADTAEAEVVTITDGETAAREIRRQKYKDIAETKELIKKVKSGEDKILTDDGDRINSYAAYQLRSKIIENRTITD